MPLEERTSTNQLSKEVLIERLEKQEKRFNQMFQNALVAMVTFHLDSGNIIQANDKCLDLLCLDPLSRISIYSFMTRSGKQRFLDELKVKGSLEKLEFELSIEGQDISVSCSAKVDLESNTVDCVLADETESKERLLELQKVNFELDSFVYHASHDLRSPLRSILGLIDIYHLESDHKVKLECIDKIQGSVNRLDDLVMELLSISRNDRINDPYVRINLMNEINNSVSSYYNASDTQGLEIRVEVRQPVRFSSDLTRVRIILNNLISNAIKYRSFETDASVINIKAHVNEKELRLVVEDNGEGIEESKLPHIFDMFYRATVRSEGSGLGLYIVKKVADKLKAKIEVNSQELEGTTFTVSIPNSNF